MKFLIISGMSGAGKTKTGEFLEDSGYYLVDNMPTALMPRFVELAGQNGAYDRVAMVSDIRGGQYFETLFHAIDELRAMGCQCHLLYMEASVPVVVARYKETRRTHPLAEPGEDLESAIRREQALLAPVRARADYVLDTSEFNTNGKLRGALMELFSAREDIRPAFSVNVRSFGFKYGIPLDGDWVMDVRFLPNPFYVKELRKKSGLDREVTDYLDQFPATAEFCGQMEQMLRFLLPHYEEEGKHNLVICMGCTGGQHRSVAMAHAVARMVQDMGYPVTETHRDMDRERK